MKKMTKNNVVFARMKPVVEQPAKPADEKYNGWVNWETWNCYCWLASNDKVYRAVMDGIDGLNYNQASIWLIDNAFDLVEMSDMDEKERSKIVFGEVLLAFAEDKRNC